MAEREIKHIKLCLDTRDAVKLNSTVKVRWNINEAMRDIQYKLNNLLYMSIYSITMPNCFYNIYGDNNDLVLRVDDGIAPYDLTATIETGNYNINTFVDALETALDAADSAPGRYTVTYSDVTYKISITVNTVGYSIKWKTSTSTMDSNIGLTQDDLSYVASATITADTIFDLRGLTQLLLKSNLNNVIRYTGSAGKSENLLEMIQMDQPFGSTVFFQNNNPLDIYTISSIPNNLEFELRKRNREVTSNNDFNYTVELLIAYND